MKNYNCALYLTSLEKKLRNQRYIRAIKNTTVLVGGGASLAIGLYFVAMFIYVVFPD